MKLKDVAARRGMLEVYRAELLRLYEEVFAHMNSGEMWGIRGTTSETEQEIGK
jgi:hypothetical protein